MEAYRAPNDDSGYLVKLIGTPWTPENAEFYEMCKAQFADSVMPANLRSILLMAGAADTRVLIFDRDAPMLVGLPVVLPHL